MDAQDREGAPPAKIPRVEAGDVGEDLEEARPAGDRPSRSPSSGSGSSNGSFGSSSDSSSSEDEGGEGQGDEDDDDDESISWMEVHDEAATAASASTSVESSNPFNSEPASELANLGLDLSDSESQFQVNLDFFADGNAGGIVDPVFVDDQDDRDHAAAGELESLEREICNSGETSSTSSPSLGLVGGGGGEGETGDPQPPPLPKEEPVTAPVPPPPKEEPPPPPAGCEEKINNISTGEETSVKEGPVSEAAGGKGEDEEDAGEESSEDDIPEGELHEMLEKDVASAEKETEEIPEPRFSRSYTLLVEKGQSRFNPLPEGWLKVCHKSGMPVYLHRATRVCSITKPYFLGAGSLKKHSIPMDAIPCWSYRNALAEENQLKQKLNEQQVKREVKKDEAGEGGELASGETEKDAEVVAGPSSLPAAPSLPPVVMHSAENEERTKSATPEDFQQYCKRLFHFKTVHAKAFSTWKHRRLYNKAVRTANLRGALQQQQGKEEEEEEAETKDIKEKGGEDTNNKTMMKRRKFSPGQRRHRQRPSLGKGAKLITIPVVELESCGGEAGQANNPLGQRVVRKRKKEWLLNPSRKTPVCILHEYVQQSLRTHPDYEYTPTDSSNTPYRATVVINGVKYGTGVGSSKKQAKMEAASKSLDILIPDFSKQKQEMESQMPDISFFNTIRIEDPRVTELCNKMSEPAPYAVLLTCLKRIYGVGDTSVKSSMNVRRNQQNEFVMRVLNREVSIICRNKREGRQLAAQKMLQQMHPSLEFWGQLLSMYGSRAMLLQKAKKDREAEVTSLQSRSASRPMPSLVILDKLKEEMRKLSEMRKAVVAPTALGKFVPPLVVATAGGDCGGVGLATTK